MITTAVLPPEVVLKIGRRLMVSVSSSSLLRTIFEIILPRSSGNAGVLCKFPRPWKVSQPHHSGLMTEGQFVEYGKRIITWRLVKAAD